MDPESTTYESFITIDQVMAVDTHLDSTSITICSLSQFENCLLETVVPLTIHNTDLNLLSQLVEASFLSSKTPLFCEDGTNLMTLHDYMQTQYCISQTQQINKRRSLFQR
ncbi:MAG: hypothetical protein ACRDAO_01525 [Culicoidibacterales bacterium]